MQDQIQNIPIQDRNQAQKIVGDEVDSNTYERLPIENFGQSLLENMVILQKQGWTEGRGVGKNTQYALKNFIQPVARPRRQGLGADPKPLFKNKKERENYENNQKRQLKEKGLFIEKDSKVKIISGKHEGLTGLVISVSNLFQVNQEQKEFYIQLDINDQIIKIYLHEIQIHTYTKERSRSRSLEKKQVQHQIIEKKHQNDYDNGQQSTNIQEEKNSVLKRNVRWIQTNIRVRVINKKSKYYNNKVIIHDIIDSMQFSKQFKLAAITEEGEIVDNLREKDLETVIPQISKKVVFVLGEYKEQIGTLQSKDKKKGTGVILIDETFEIIEAKLDQFCDFQHN